MRQHTVSLSSLTSRSPWLWSIVGSLVVWVLIGVVSLRFTISSLTANIELASFLIIVALGQMLVITAGAGGIDLSVPFTLTLSAFLSASLMNGHNSMVLVGLLVGLAAGLAFGAMNAAIILGFGIPPIVATLSVGFIGDSATNVYTSRVLEANPAPSLESFVHNSLAGIPWMAVLAFMLTLVIGFFMQRTLGGRYLEAVGQSDRAARLSGIRTWQIRAGSYMVSGLLAGLAGVLYAGYSGGAFLRMGDPYQLTSIGAVVLGGTLIAGGRATAIGTFGGALFLTLVVTLIEVSKQAIGIQYIIEGILIILVLLGSTRTRPV